MSTFPKETVEVIAESIGIADLSSDVSLALAADVEYRLREIMQGEQEAIKCMRHCRRTVLTADDIDSALSLRNVEPIYGFAFGDPLRFKRAMGHKDLFYVDDRDVAFKEVIDALLPKAPLDTAVVAHWLAIDGVQPAIPENTPIQVAAPSENKKSHHGKEDDLPVDIKLPVEHVLSRELQMYFDKITELTMTMSESILFKQALVSLATDSGIPPLVPYFSYFIADEVPRNLSDLSILFSLMRVVQSLLRNPHIHIEPYLHQLMPTIITCVVAKKLGSGIVDNHWELRDFSAKLAASICRRYGLVYQSLQSRLMKTLVKAFLDPLKALTQHYGAIQGLAALGPSVVHLLVLPNLETYMKLLEPEMQLDKHKNEIKRKETWRVYGALLCAAGTCLYDRLKLFPGLLSPPRQLLVKNNVKVATTWPKKRESNDDYSLQQPPLKKLAVDGSMGPIQTIGFARSLHLPTQPSGPGMGASSSSGQASDEGIRGGTRSKKVGCRAPNVSTTLTQAWKEDVDVGYLFASLFEVFGEGILSYIQPAEMSLFL